MIELLAKCNLFKGMAVEEMSELFENLNYQKKSYEQEQVVAYADTEIKSLYILIEGEARGEMMDFSGKTIKIEDLDAPTLLAPAFLFGKINKFPVTIIANKPSIVVSIPKSSFVKLIQTNEILLTNFLNNISNRAQFLSNKLRFLSFQSLKGKIAHFLIQLSKKTGKDEFLMPKSQNELAEMFGVARPSLGRTIRELDKDGVIKAEGKKITLLDKEKLKGFMK